MVEKLYQTRNEKPILGEKTEELVYHQRICGGGSFSSQDLERIDQIRARTNYLVPENSRKYKK